VLLWRRPADVWSLLLVQTPLRARRALQQRLSSLQDHPLMRVGLLLGAALALPLLWRLDASAAVASGFSPLAGSPRLVGLLLAAGLLAVMLWQWQQLLQALWLLSRSPAAIAAAPAMDQSALEQHRLSLGIPLLLPDPLTRSEAPSPPTARVATPTPAPTPSPSPEPWEEGAEQPLTEPPLPAVEDAGAEAATASADLSVAVEPEQAAEQDEGSDLEEQVS
jgi:hypothetical protein